MLLHILHIDCMSILDIVFRQSLIPSYVQITYPMIYSSWKRHVLDTCRKLNCCWLTPYSGNKMEFKLRDDTLKMKYPCSNSFA